MAKSSDSKLFAFLAVLLSIVGFLIALLSKKKDKYVMHYAKQSLVLFICLIAINALMMVPILGWMLGMVLWLVWVVLWMITIVYSLSGDKKETPLIGKYAKKIDL